MGVCSVLLVSIFPTKSCNRNKKDNIIITHEGILLHKIFDLNNMARKKKKEINA